MYAFHKLSHKFLRDISSPQDLEKEFLMINLQEPAF